MGTISTVVIGISIYFLGDITEVPMGVAESLCYGALISAVDPVATLAVFGVLKVEPNLNYRVFGESIINDAVSIVLFRVFGTFITTEVTPLGVVGAVGMFLRISIGSFLMGIVVSLIASFVMKAAHIHDPLLAAGTFVLCSYISYEVTESLHLSGIIASLFCGFGMKHYALKNIAEQYAEMVCDMVHMLASMADLAIFFSVGVNVILMMPYDKWTFIACSMGLCLVGRMCNIFPLCNLYNLFVPEKRKIPFADQIVMVHAGLRGAIAFALALTFPTNHQKYVIDATTWIVLITVFVFGGTTVTVLKVLGIQLGCDDERQGGDEKYLDLGKMKTELDGVDSFNCKFKMLLCEPVRRPVGRALARTAGGRQRARLHRRSGGLSVHLAADQDQGMGHLARLGTRGEAGRDRPRAVGVEVAAAELYCHHWCGHRCQAARLRPRCGLRPGCTPAANDREPGVVLRR